MKSLMLNMMAAAALVFLCGCSTGNRDLPQTAASQHSTDRILVQIEPATVTGNHMVDSAIVKKLETFLYNKFSSSARFVVLTGSKEDLAGTQKKLLRITPILTYHRRPGYNGNIYYCQTTISCRLLDLPERPRCYELAGVLDFQVVHGPHLVLPHVGGDDRVVI